MTPAIGTAASLVSSLLEQIRSFIEHHEEQPRHAVSSPAHGATAGMSSPEHNEGAYLALILGPVAF